MRRQLAQDRRRLFVAAGGQRAAVAAADMSGKRVAGEMIRQPGQPLRHFAELLIDMQIQIQIPAGCAAQQIFHGGGVPVGGVDEAAQQAALSAVGDRPGDGLRLRQLAKQGQRDQRHPLQVMPTVSRRAISCQASGASAVNQSTWLRKWVTPFAAARASAADARR